MFSDSMSLLAEEAFAWTATRAIPTSQPQTVDPALRFPIRSGLQKAVRRGQEQRALDLAVKLHRLDAPYLWRSLLTVAVEDVGSGSPDAVLWSTGGTLKGFRDLIGELPLLSALVVEMCRAAKSRAGCDLSMPLDEAQPDAFRRFGSMARTDLLSFVSGGDPRDCYFALCILRGVVPPGLKMQPHDPEGIEAACEIVGDQLPIPYARAAMHTLRRPLDGMSLAAFPTYRLALSQPTKVRPDVLLPGRDIGHFAAEAFDQHERSGRRAIQAFSRDIMERSSALRALGREAAARTVANAVFVVEGALLNRRINNGSLAALRDSADAYMVTKFGLPDWHTAELCQLVRDQIEVLHDHRTRLCSPNSDIR